MEREEFQPKRGTSVN